MPRDAYDGYGVPGGGQNELVTALGLPIRDDLRPKQASCGRGDGGGRGAVPEPEKSRTRIARYCEYSMLRYNILAAYMDVLSFASVTGTVSRTYGGVRLGPRDQLGRAVSARGTSNDRLKEKESD